MTRRAGVRGFVHAQGGLSFFAGYDRADRILEEYQNPDDRA